MHPQRVANVRPDLEQNRLSEGGMGKTNNCEKSKCSFFNTHTDPFKTHTDRFPEPT